MLAGLSYWKTRSTPPRFCADADSIGLSGEVAGRSNRAIPVVTIIVAIIAAKLTPTAKSNPRFSPPYMLHTAALAELGRSDDAKAMAQRLLELEPGITTSTAIRSARYANPEKIAALRSALHKAGLPEE